MILPFTTPAEIEHALPAVLAHLRADGIIAYPTETVYGFGGTTAPAAVERLRRLKRRDAVKPFLLLIEGPGSLPGLEWTPAARTLAEIYWPGPLTLVLHAADSTFAPGVVTADGTVAVRASPHEAVRALVRALAGPLTSTSANAPHEPPARDAAGAAAALAALGADDVLVLDGGELPPSPPSTLVACDAHQVRIVREGAITVAELQKRLRGTGIDVR